MTDQPALGLHLLRDYVDVAWSLLLQQWSWAYMLFCPLKSTVLRRQLETGHAWSNKVQPISIEDTQPATNAGMAQSVELVWHAAHGGPWCKPDPVFRVARNAPDRGGRPLVPHHIHGKNVISHCPGSLPPITSNNSAGA